MSIQKNELTHVDNIPINWFPNSRFNLKFYNTIKRIQKRIKFRFKKKSEAVIKIQRGCHDWLWKPILKDGQHGINPRLLIKKLNLI